MPSVAPQRPMVGQVARFAAVGGVGFVLDTTVFAILRLTVLAPERVHEGPLVAKVASTTLAIAANWLGNRFWTFRSDRRSALWREAIEFVLASLLGMAVAVGCLWVSHYRLGLTTPLEDALAGNLVGLVLGSAVRFCLYRWWVYRPAWPTPRPMADRGRTVSDERTAQAAARVRRGPGWVPSEE